MKTTTYRVTEMRGTKWGDGWPVVLGDNMTLEAAKKLADQGDAPRDVWDTTTQEHVYG